jgi:hypothetical protein
MANARTSGSLWITIASGFIPARPRLKLGVDFRITLANLYNPKGEPGKAKGPEPSLGSGPLLDL